MAYERFLSQGKSLRAYVLAEEVKHPKDGMTYHISVWAWREGRLVFTDLLWSKSGGELLYAMKKLDTDLGERFKTRPFYAVKKEYFLKATRGYQRPIICRQCQNEWLLAGMREKGAWS